MKINEFWKNASFFKKGLFFVLGIVFLIILFLIGRIIFFHDVGKNFSPSFSPPSFSEYSQNDTGGFSSGKTYERIDLPQEALLSSSYDVYEKRAYKAFIRTSHYEKMCEKVDSFRAEEIMILDSAIKERKGCRYIFKSEKINTESVLEKIEKLNPYEIQMYSSSGQKQIMQYFSEKDILLKQEALLTLTLENAENAYTEIVLFSQKAGNVDVLAKALDAKIRHIQNISKERLLISERLSFINRNLSEIEEEIAFVYFAINVEGYSFVDTHIIKGEWISAVQDFFDTLFKTLIALTLGLLTFILFTMKFVVYAGIVLGALFVFFFFFKKMYKKMFKKME
jgi:hypothetical protein